jgi:hypothetical protein
VHGTRSWRQGYDEVRIDGVAARGYVDDDGESHDGPVALVLIRRPGGVEERRHMAVGDRVVLGGEWWQLTRIGDRGRMAEWLSHEPTVPGRQPGRFCVFSPQVRD